MLLLYYLVGDSKMDNKKLPEVGEIWNTKQNGAPFKVIVVTKDFVITQHCDSPTKTEFCYTLQFFLEWFCFKPLKKVFYANEYRWGYSTVYPTKLYADFNVIPGTEFIRTIKFVEADDQD